jgi:hypothetical protein
VSSKNGHKPAGLKPWERQEGESDKAFDAFRVYLEAGPKRSLKAVSQRLSKSLPLLKRWSVRWKWRIRVRKHIDSLTTKTDEKLQRAAHRQFLRIMGRKEVLARTTALASGSMADLLTDGRFDLKKGEKRGALYLVKRLRIRETTRTLGDGSVEESTLYDATLRDKIGALHDLGTHHCLWSSEIDDQEEVLSRVLGYAKSLIPATLEPDPNAGAVDGDVIDGIEEGEL